MSALAYPNPTSPLYKIACDFIRAANDRDFDLLESLVSDDFTQQFWPSSNRPGQEDRANKKLFLERARMMLSDKGMFKALNVDVDHPVNVVEGKDAIVLQLNSSGILASGAPWPQEYVHIFRFNADQKIVSADGWNDSALARTLLPGAAFPKFGEGGKVLNVKEANKAMKEQVGQKQ